jgi:hypothetical protein
MAAPVVAFDESGNTRGNLLDPNQPVAVVASVLLSDQAADDCLARLRAVTRQDPASEVHYKGLKSDRGRKGVAALLASDVLTPDTVRVVVAHKPFAAVCKLVDLTLEPMFHDSGLNLYEDGAARATANLLYATAPVLTDADRWGTLVETFNRACAQPRADAFQAFGRAVDDWSRTAGKIGELSEMLRLASRFLPAALHDHKGQPLSDPLDPALPLFVLLAHSWGTVLQEDFAVLHDHSTVIERWVDILHRLDELPDPTGQQAHLSALRIAPGQLIPDADSKEHSRLQVADIVVGAVRTWALTTASGQPLSPASAALRELTMPWVIDALWPSLD